MKKNRAPAKPDLPLNRKRQASAPTERPKWRVRAGRWGWRAVEVVALVAALSGVVLLARWVHRYVTTSEAFAIKGVEVSGQHRMTAEELQTLSGLTPGTNIFSTSPAEATRRLMAQAWIAKARVRRRLPSSVAIEVQERQPLALLQLEALYLVDLEGTVFKRVESGDPVDLPVMTGIGQDRAAAETAGLRHDLEEALGLVRLYEESGLGRRYPLAEVHLESDGTFSLYTTEEATHVRLGRPPFRRKLRQLARLLRELRSQNAVADYVYLEDGVDQTQSDRAVVRLR